MLGGTAGGTSIGPSGDDRKISIGETDCLDAWIEMHPHAVAAAPGDEIRFCIRTQFLAKAADPLENGPIDTGKGHRIHVADANTATHAVFKAGGNCLRHRVAGVSPGFQSPPNHVGVILVDDGQDGGQKVGWKPSVAIDDHRKAATAQLQ